MFLSLMPDVCVLVNIPQLLGTSQDSEIFSEPPGLQASLALVIISRQDESEGLAFILFESNQAGPGTVA